MGDAERGRRGKAKIREEYYKEDEVRETSKIQQRRNWTQNRKKTGAGNKVEND